MNLDDFSWTVYKMATSESPGRDTNAGHMKLDGCMAEIRSSSAASIESEIRSSSAASIESEIRSPSAASVSPRSDHEVRLQRVRMVMKSCPPRAFVR